MINWLQVNNIQLMKRILISFDHAVYFCIFV